MASAAAVLVCVLSLLGRAMPPVTLLDSRPVHASANAEAFVRPNDHTIYLLTCTEVFQDARRGHLFALRKLASILVHEEWHLLHGPDERGAYSAQLIALLSLGEAPDRPVTMGVRRAMMTVLRGQSRRAEATLAAP